MASLRGVPTASGPASAVHGALAERLEAATLVDGGLNGIGTQLPGVVHFLYTCARKKAVLPSAIEGNVLSLLGRLLFERGRDAERRWRKRPRRSRAYIAVPDHATEMQRCGLPVAHRPLRETHPGTAFPRSAVLARYPVSTGVHLPAPATQPSPSCGEVDALSSTAGTPVRGLSKRDGQQTERAPANRRVSNRLFPQLPSAATTTNAPIATAGKLRLIPYRQSIAESRPFVLTTRVSERVAGGIVCPFLQ